MSDVLHSAPALLQLSNFQIVFYREVYMVVDAHYSNSSFNACCLAKELKITRRQLYREMNKLDTSPANFIKEFRLRRALQFLESGAVRRVKELCHLVGYENSETFSKHFIEHYGYRPSELIRKQVA